MLAWRVFAKLLQNSFGAGVAQLVERDLAKVGTPPLPQFFRRLSGHTKPTQINGFSAKVRKVQQTCGLSDFAEIRRFEGYYAPTELDWLIGAPHTIR